MRFTIRLLRNLAILVVLAIVLYITKPSTMMQFFVDYWLYFTPLLLLLVVFLAFPLKKKR